MEPKGRDPVDHCLRQRRDYEYHMTTRCVLLDFGNVIAFFDHRKACRQLAELSTAALDGEHIYQAIFESGLETGYDTGRISTAEFLEGLRQAFCLDGSDAEIGRAWSDIFTPNPSMASAIRALNDRGVRMVLASNTNALHHEWFASLFADTLAAIDAQVLSYRVGCRKPERAFFSACLAAARCAPAECLYVDDRDDFVTAGRELGVNGLVYIPGVDVVGATCY
jgi:FMN phosphatase YigB (HAD superfamily)